MLPFCKFGHSAIIVSKYSFKLKLRMLEASKNSRNTAYFLHGVAIHVSFTNAISLSASTNIICNINTIQFIWIPNTTFVLKSKLPPNSILLLSLITIKIVTTSFIIFMINCYASSWDVSCPSSSIFFYIFLCLTLHCLGTSFKKL